MDVHLLVYDLSNGLARQLSMSLLGFQLDAIYHTSVELAGVEYVYDGGIARIQPGSSHLGQPLERLLLGRTELPLEDIMEYVESLRTIFTAEAYDLFRHNCNNFSHDFAMFLLGKGIPERISNMPQAVLDSPFGKMLQPQLEQIVQARKAQQGGLLGIPSDSSSNGNSTGDSTNNTVKVLTPTSPNELKTILGKSKASIIFFTSATCPPCKALYPLYDQLAVEFAGQVALVKIDVSVSVALGAQYDIRATPTFATFTNASEQERWSGADGSRLRSTVSLLAQTAAGPTHPHRLLRLPTIANPDAASPVLFAKMPPLDKLAAKMGDDVSAEPSIKTTITFLATRDSQGAAGTHVPDLPAFATTLRRVLSSSDPAVVFALVDLFRCALSDARVSGYFSEEADLATMHAVLEPAVKLGSECSYALRLVTLQASCNLFSSPVFAHTSLSESSSLRPLLVQLLTGSFLDTAHAKVRVTASALLFNVAMTNGKARAKHAELLPEADQIEIAASVLEAIGQEDESGEALHGMLLGLGHLVFCASMEGGLVDLLRSLEAEAIVERKQGRFGGKELVGEIGRELLGKGLRRL